MACHKNATTIISQIQGIENFSIDLQSGELRIETPNIISIEKLNRLFSDSPYTILKDPITIKKTYYVNGMQCNGCVNTITKKIIKIEGVQDVKIDLKTKEISIRYKGSKIPFHIIKRSLEESHHTIFQTKEELQNQYSETTQTSNPIGKYYCPMYCEGDKTYESNSGCPVCGMDLVQELSHDISIQEANEQELKEYHALRRILFIAALCTIPLFLIAMTPMMIPNSGFFIKNKNVINWLQLILSLPVYFYCASFIFRRAWNSLKGFNFNMYTLIGLGSGIAWIYSLIVLIAGEHLPLELRDQHGHIHLYFEAGTMILTLALLGQLLEFRANIKTKDSIKSLLELSSNTALKIFADGTEVEVETKDLQVGDIIKVKAGEKVPIDGIIKKGESEFDESMLTGESKPIFKNEKAEIFGGSINGNHIILMEVTKIGKDTLLSQIIELVKNASRSKAPIQQLVDRIARHFVPIVVIVSIITFACWMLLGPSPTFIYALVNAIAVLIIACPCALGLATPMSVMVGVGKGAENGILIKDAKVIEELQKIDTVVLDKTGTLTEGKPRLIDMYAYHEDFTKDEITRLSIALNRNSNHPLAKALIHYGKDNKIYVPYIVMTSQELPGKGIIGDVNGMEVCIGNRGLMEHIGAKIPKEITQNLESHTRLGRTVTLVASNKNVIGYLVFEDKIKASSRKMIKSLRAQNLDLIIISGDHPDVTKVVAETLNISTYYGNVLPEGKLQIIKELQEKGRVVAMVGDGINDAPALTLSNVGVAMGTGTDVALQSAQVTLMNGDMRNLPEIFKLSQKIMRNIRQNLWFAFGYNILGIPIAAGILYPFFGVLLSPMLAALAMSFSSVSVISNALRLRKIDLK